MSNIKKEYLMTDAEAAYFIYKWISQNIEIDCLGNKYGNSSKIPATTYKEGKGGHAGISGLFSTMCGFLDIESNTIFGIKKHFTHNYTGNLTDFKEYSWNYISIDNQYYLIDTTSGVGLCDDVSFFRIPNEDYEPFGIEPNVSIRHLFPNDKKWQLLYEPISEEKFKSQAFLKGSFFEFFGSISPDIQTIKNKKNMKIKLTVKDPKIKKFSFYEEYDIENEMLPLASDQKDFPVVNGTCEYTVNHLGTGYTFVYISIKEGSSEKLCGSIAYEIYDK